MVTDDQIAAVMGKYRGRQRIPLAELADDLGIPAVTRTRLLKNGLVREAEGKRDPRGRIVLEESEAQRLVRGALIAAAAGVALAVILRAMGEGL